MLIMIQAHTLDSWTLPAERTRKAYAWAVMVGGMGAPLFLFLAGVSVVFAAAGRSATLGGAAAAARTVRRRGWQIFLYAFLFRLQSFVLNPGSPAIGLLKVDILNVMGPSIVGVAALWEVARGLRGRVVLLGAVTVAIAMLTPLVRATPLLSNLPDPVEWYLRPVPGHTNFTMFPWSGFLSAGAVVGLFLHGARDPRRERRVIGSLAVAGVLLAGGGYVASYLPPIYASTNFWTSSPTFFCLRTGILLMGIPLAWAWEQRPWAAGRWRPLVLLGVESLFVYWIHVEMVYGVLTGPLHRQLRLPWVFAGFAGFSLLMLLAVVLKQRGEARWRGRRTAPPATT